jgi:hypothetical protein
MQYHATVSDGQVDNRPWGPQHVLCFLYIHIATRMHGSSCGRYRELVSRG